MNAWLAPSKHCPRQPWMKNTKIVEPRSITMTVNIRATSFSAQISSGDIRPLDNVPTIYYFRRIWSKWKPFWLIPSKVGSSTYRVRLWLMDLLNLSARSYFCCFFLHLFHARLNFPHATNRIPATKRAATWITTTSSAMHRIGSPHPRKTIHPPKWTIAVNWSTKHRSLNGYRIACCVRAMNIGRW